MGVECNNLLAAGPVPANLKCLFIIEDAEITPTALHALDLMCATGLFPHNTGMVTVEVRCQPSMQHSNGGSYYHQLCFCLEVRYILYLYM